MVVVLPVGATAAEVVVGRVADHALQLAVALFLGPEASGFEVLVGDSGGGKGGASTSVGTVVVARQDVPALLAEALPVVAGARVETGLVGIDAGVENAVCVLAGV